MDTEAKGTLAVLVSTFVVGLNVYFTKVGTTLISQLPFTAICITLAGSILLVVNIILGKLPVIFSGKRHLLKFLWMGIVGMSIPSVMLAYGVSLSLVSNSFLLQIEAIYSMILSYMLLKERITKKQVLLSVLSFLGMALVLTEGVIRPINLGDILFLSTPLFYQFAHVVAKDVLKTIDPTVVVMYRFLIGGLTLFFVSVLFGLNPLDFSSTLQGTLIVFYMGFGYAIGNSFWYYGIKHINLSKGTSMIIMYPLVSTILAILTLGETLTPIKVIGIILVFLSTLILSRVKSGSRN